MPPSESSFDLERFVEAQAQNYEDALAELQAGRKRTHWMWYVFPQLEGLGASPMARRYAIRSLSEAKAYLCHPLLGRRLRECTEVVNAIRGRTLLEIFGDPDHLKFRSSMTLFSVSSGSGETCFQTALAKYCDSQADSKTLELLETARGQPNQL